MGEVMGANACDEILGIFRCIRPVADGGKLEANTGQPTSQLLLMFPKKERGVVFAMPSDFFFFLNLGILIFSKIYGETTNI